MDTNERALYIYDKCRQAGMTYAGAIGVLGNLQGETSDFDPMSCETSYLNRFKLTDAEYTRRADNGEIIYNGKYFEKDSAGYGIVQWTWWERKRNLLNYAKSLGKSVGDLDIQVAFMLKEMQEKYTSVWKVVSTTTDYIRAVRICVTDYEKPANQSQAVSTRCAYAKEWMNIIKDKVITPDEPKGEPKQDDTPTVSNSFDRKKIIALAESEVGYLEKRSNSQLDDKTANAGSNNYTKYARDLDAINGFYNGKKQGFAWCDIFVDWLFVKCFGVENALKLLCSAMGSSGAGCTYSLNYYLAKGRFIKRGADKPQVGDQIFFGAVGNSNHTGIVYKVNNNKVYTIEGNTSGASGVVANGGGVFKKSYSLDYVSIAGYGRPDYNDEFNDNSTDGSESAAKDKNESKTLIRNVVVNLPILQKGDIDVSVAMMQSALSYLGYNIKWIDGEFGSNTYDVLKIYQSAKFLEVDGICGKETWQSLINDVKGGTR